MVTLRRSCFLHRIELGAAGVLLIHAISQVRLPVSEEVAAIADDFATGCDRDEAVGTLAARFEVTPAAIAACIAALESNGVLVTTTEDEEREAASAALAPVHGRDPAAMLDQYRRTQAQGAHAYWNVTAPRALGQAPPVRGRADILLLGDCDVQMETDFLRQEAASRGIELRVAATFASDVALAGERPHDAVVIGALQARHAVLHGTPADHGGDPARGYLLAAEALLAQLREVTAAPILLDALPEPTVQPLGLAERGLHGHRNRIRRINLALSDLVGRFVDVHLVDIAAALGQAGSAALVDDGLVSFGHFGSPGWMLQRPESERRAVHGIVPDLGALADAVHGDPYARERVTAAAHMDALATVLALDRRKCVIVDLDGVLWPGTLAETGSPFAWTPDISGPNSHVGLWFGIHEALRCLMRRGIVLACVSKNDAAVVERLWRYGPHDPVQRLLRPDHFVTVRVNWQDKAENVRSIVDELGFAEDAFIFIDDTPRERERVRTALPGIEVWGDDIVTLRRRLLTDPRLQAPSTTEAASGRTSLVRAQLERAREREAASDEGAFVAGLDVVAEVERLAGEALEPGLLARVQELLERTTQFNATGERFAAAELAAFAARPDTRVFVLRMRDRLADHGLVGVAIVDAGAIRNLVMSCRVIGLGGERALLAAVVADPGGVLTGRIVATDRNLPVRHLYAANGFEDAGDGVYRVSARASSGSMIGMPSRIG